MVKFCIILAVAMWSTLSSASSRFDMCYEVASKLTGETLQKVYETGTANLQGNYLGEVELVIKFKISKYDGETWNSVIRKILKDEGLGDLLVTYVSKSSQVFPTLLEIAVNNLNYFKNGNQIGQIRLKNIYKVVREALEVYPLGLFSIDSSSTQLGERSLNGLAVVDYEYDEIVIMLTGSKQYGIYEMLRP